MLSGDILDILELHPASRSAVAANEIHNHSGKGIKIFGWPVIERVYPVANSDKPMMFLTVEDKTGCVDVIFWPRSYSRYASVLAKPGPYEIWGKVTEEWDTFSLEVESIKEVQWSPSQVDFELAARRLEQSFKSTYTYDDIGSVGVA